MIKSIRNFPNKCTLQGLFIALCNTSISLGWESTVQMRSCNRVVSGVQVCSGALAVWEQLLGCILWYRSALSFVVGILLYGWWLWPVSSGVPVCITIHGLDYCFSYGAASCPNPFLIYQGRKFSLRPFLWERLCQAVKLSLCKCI